MVKFGSVSAYDVVDFYDIDSVVVSEGLLRNCASRCTIKESK